MMICILKPILKKLFIQKSVISFFSIVVCLMNYSLAIGDEYDVGNPGSQSVKYTVTNAPADAKITNVKVEYSYSHCPYDDVTITLSKQNGDAPAILVKEDKTAQYVSLTQAPITWNSPAGYFANSKANDVWILTMAITSNGCPSSTCNPSYSGHTAKFSPPASITIDYDHTPPTLNSPADRFFSGSSSINFQWSSLPNADNYNIAIFDGSSFSKSVTTSSTSFNTSSDSSLSLQPNQKYFWNVNGTNAVGGGKSSETRSFITGQAECWPEMGNDGYRGFYTCYDGSNYQLKDIARRANMKNIFLRNGHMSDTASIITQLYVTTGPLYPMTDADNTWADSAQEPGVDAQVHSATVYDYLSSTFQLFSPDGNNNSSMFNVIRSQASDNCNTSYWDSRLPTQTVTFCTGSPYYSSDSLGRIAHEWTHVVTNRATTKRCSYLFGCESLGVEGEAGALDEAFSDWMATAIKHAKGDPSWALTFLSSTRNLAYPRNSSPAQPEIYGGANWIDTYWCFPVESNDYCGIHRNTGVLNKMFYLLSDGGVFNSVTVSGIGIDKAIQVAYQANMRKWESDLIFRDALTGMISAAQDLNFTAGDVDQIYKAWAAVGVTLTTTPQTLMVKKLMPIFSTLLLSD